jgi:4-hydroxythreonine-4-phosphate dehydrogenase
MPAQLPRVALTLGDPAGIGPELVLRALLTPAVRAVCVPVVYGNQSLLRRVAAATGVMWPPPSLVIRSPAEAALHPDGGAAVLLDFPDPEAAVLQPGRVQAACGRLAHTWILAAARDALAGRVAAVVTAPINKEALHVAGIRHPGHTEILADLTGTSEAVMLFWSSRLVVSLTTIHVALADVPRLLTCQRILTTIRLTAAAMRAPGSPPPRIGVLALNPHGGERGLFGREESLAIAPAIEAARAEGIDAAGPLVPDTAFTWLRPAASPASDHRPYDAYVAMYHDQGLIPFKLVAFDEGVNVTLGLPIVRTSPDHGTAFDLAWQGRASPTSFLAAIHCALRLSGNRQRRQLIAGRTPSRSGTRIPPAP